MNLLGAIITLSGMASAVRVSHATVATRRRDLLGLRAHDVMNTLNGVWVLAGPHDGALKDFLVSVGAPRMFAGPLAKAFDSDAIQLNVFDKNGGRALSVETPKRSWSLPIKLNTNAVYHTNEVTLVATPRGNQRASLQPSTYGDATIVKHGPADGERVLERYRAVDESHIEQELTHVTVRGHEVVVRRTFKRA